MPAIRRALVVLTAVLTALPAAPASAAPGPAEARTLIESRLAPVRAVASTLRSTFAEGTVSAAVRAGAIAAERASALEELPAGDRRPLTLDDAVDGIVAAVLRADAMVKDGPAADLPAWVGRRALEAAIRGDADPAAFPGIEPVDPTIALRGAALIARTVDRAMPALRAAAATLPAGPAGADCDVVDEDDVCVGGTGANTHTRDALVSIDLGGNDTYTNDAAAVALAAQLVLDVGGDDVYRPDGIAGHAFGGTGGIGILVDTAGSDRYVLESTTTSVSGQGLGVLGGVGILVDGGGNDVRRMDSEVEGAAAGAGGMGEAVLGGVGVLMDGGGDDAYSATGITHPVLIEPTSGDDPMTAIGRAATTIGGVGVLAGAGVLWDAGGDDSFTAHARMTAAPPEWPAVNLTSEPPSGSEQYVSVNGLGEAVLAGVGYLLEGAGPTEYRLQGVVESLPLDGDALTMSSAGMGLGAVGATGVLSDAGGDDTYAIDLSSTTAMSRTVDDTCGSPCTPAGPNVTAVPASATVQGYGVQGVGLIDDAGGADRYSAILGSVAQAVARDDRTEAAATHLDGRLIGQDATLRAQGTSLAQGLGIVADAGGDDSYTSEVSTRAETDTSSALPANEPVVFTTVGVAQGITQATTSGAGGTGAILDLGGDDAYAAAAAADIVHDGSEPLTSEIVFAAQAAATDGANGLGFLLDLDGTGTDTFATTPVLEACDGTRGEGLWQDCGSYGVGLNG